jgi:aminoglycoside phosphotransferase (APT) family kinase protein
MGAMDLMGIELEELSGGYSGETFVAQVGDEPLVVRIYRRHPDRAAIDASLLRLLRGLMPVPEVVELRQATDATPAVLVTEYLPSVRLEEVLADPPDDLDWETLGLQLGWVLGGLSHIPFVRQGMFVDADLSVSAELMPIDLLEWAQTRRATGRLSTWPDADWQGLLDVIERAEEVLDDAADHDDRAVLVHGDFNPKNILLDPESLDVTGLVDWEFAHAGSIHTDFGNFTRFERDERLIEPFVEGFVDAAPGHIRDPFGHGRAMDLWALVELAGRPAGNAVTELAATLLLAQARGRDLEAWPWDESRKAP